MGKQTAQAEEVYLLKKNRSTYWVLTNITLIYTASKQRKISDNISMFSKKNSH